MQAQAIVRGISMSPRKMRVVANLVRGKSVEAAVGMLDLMPKKAAALISKAIKSASANAEDRSGGEVSVESLRIHTIAVDGGAIQKRWMPRSMGRANRINHRTSHLTVVVTDEARNAKPASAARPAAEASAKADAEASAKPAKAPAKKAASKSTKAPAKKTTKKAK